MNIELNSYGFMVDSHWFYIALSWWAIGLSVGIAIMYKVTKRNKREKIKCRLEL